MWNHTKQADICRKFTSQIKSVSLPQSPCLFVIASHTIIYCLEPGQRPADVSRNLSHYPVDGLWYNSGISGRT